MFKFECIGIVYISFVQFKKLYYIIEFCFGYSIDNDEESFMFFEIYYGGFEVLVKEEDFYELVMNYFEKVVGMNVRYCELFFDLQGYMRRGVKWEMMMGGF